MKTRVIFCHEETTDPHNEVVKNILAVFPHEKFDRIGNLICYSHVGSHSGCSRSYFESLKVCDNPQDYLELKQELVSIGYNLNVINEQLAIKQIKRVRI